MEILLRSESDKNVLLRVIGNGELRLWKAGGNCQGECYDRSIKVEVVHSSHII